MSIPCSSVPGSSEAPDARRSRSATPRFSATPFVISYFTRDIDANRRFYGDFLGMHLHTEPGLEQVFFLCGHEDVRMQILLLPAELEQAAAPISSGLVILGVATAEELSEVRRRAQRLRIPEQAARQGEAARVARFLDPDGRIIIVQLFNGSRRFHD